MFTERLWSCMMSRDICHAASHCWSIVFTRVCCVVATYTDSIDLLWNWTARRTNKGERVRGNCIDIYCNWWHGMLDVWKLGSLAACRVWTFLVFFMSTAITVGSECHSNMCDQKSQEELNKELWAAVEQNNAEEVGRLLLQKADVNYMDKDFGIVCSCWLLVLLPV